jgi:signal transduction histidine kinase
LTIRIDLPKAVRRAGRRRWSKASLRRVQLVLDGVAIVLGLAAFFQVGHAELALHGIWIVMAVQGFLFGLRFVLLRIAVATVAIFAHPVIAGPSPAVVGLELFESQVMTIVAIIIAIMADRLASNSRRYARLYREASDRLLTAQEDERLRLARDIHDGVGQTLAALTFTLDAAETMLWTGERKHLTLTRAAVGRAQELAGIAIDETRDVAFRLRPARFAQTGLGAGIQELAATAGVAVDVRIEPDLAHPRLLAPDDEMEVYRIVQEALGNATRYALADHIWIAMEADKGMLKVTIRDDGIGFDPDEVGERGLGLPGMTERAFLLRADLQVRSAPGAGTAITLTLPLPAAAAAAGQPTSTPRFTSTETVAAQ